MSNPHPELLWYATQQLTLISAPSTDRAPAEPRLLLEALDRNARGPAFAPDSSAVYFVLEDSGERHLARVAVDDGAVTRPIDGPRAVGPFSVGKTGLISSSMIWPD